MDALLLSRIQFGITIGFHYLFPITTLGLTFFILLFEISSRVTGNIHHKSATVFLTKILGLIFTMGVATGLLLPLAFGTNWSRFSGYAGAVFGPALTLEAVSAFALESICLGLLLFARDRVSSRIHLLSFIGVFVGAHLSAFWIVSANSWMQTPAGFALQNNVLVLTSYWDAVFNPSMLLRFLHVITAAWLTGAVVVCAIAAWYLLKNRFSDFSKALLKPALPLFFALALSQILVGHFHILQVVHHNPAKDAEFEGIFESQNGAPIYAFGIPDAANRTIRFGIAIPYGLSFLETGDPMGRVIGLSEFPEEEWPPVNIIFTTFHLMVMLGSAMLGLSAFGLWLLRKKKLFETRWYLTALTLTVPLPYLANELGWISTEIGRQPWIILGVQRTAEASTSTLPAWQIALTLTLLTTVYLALTLFAIFLTRRMVLKGPSGSN